MPLDLEAVRQRFADFEHYWPPTPQGTQTSSERIVAAKRCARDVPRLLARIEDLERELRLLRQHTAGCGRCAAVEEETAAKRSADV